MSHHYQQLDDIFHPTDPGTPGPMHPDINTRLVGKCVKTLLFRKKLTTFFVPVYGSTF
jgi:hypothetical protein